jgi:hypothetical protein
VPLILHNLANYPKSTKLEQEDDGDKGKGEGEVEVVNRTILRPTPVISGYLWKKGEKGLLKTWKKRWFYLEDNVLYYIKHK